MAKKKDKIANPYDPTSVTTENHALALAVDAIMQIGEERRVYLENMCAALKAGDDAELKVWASRLCGMPADPARMEGNPRGKQNQKTK